MILKDSILASLGKYTGGEAPRMENIVIIYVHIYLLFLIVKRDISHWEKWEPNITGLNVVSENSQRAYSCLYQQLESAASEL